MRGRARLPDQLTTTLKWNSSAAASGADLVPPDDGFLTNPMGDTLVTEIPGPVTTLWKSLRFWGGGDYTG